MKPTSNYRLKKIYKIPLADVYPFYVSKVEKKGRNKGEVDQVICWMTGHTVRSLEKELENKTDFETFFKTAPKMNPKRKLITGTICGVRIEEIEEKTMREIRYIDKLVDELLKGRAIENILRS